MTECFANTPCGVVRGEEWADARIYRGIPYAATPRFEKPEQVTHWDGVLDATQEELDCCQWGTYKVSPPGQESFYAREFPRTRTPRFAETPQTLTVITPKEARSCPVLVFIHGGGFETGTVGDAPYGRCREYAQRGIVLVSVGHRLNVFSLYECENYGLQDQMTAIQWIRENIRAFGGDPDRITLMGQSAGAMSITDLCLTQTLKGSIRGVILMSGGGPIPRLAGPLRKHQAAPFWEAVRQRAGAQNHQEAKALPAEALWNGWYQVSREYKGFSALQPGIDGQIIPDDPSAIAKAGLDLDVPVMIGVTSQDFMPVILYELALGWGLRNSRMGREKVYGYFFDRTPPGNRFKAFHGADLWYMFGGMDLSWRPFAQEDRALAGQMMDYVAAFVRTGDPNAPGLPLWKPLARDQKGFRLLNGQSSGLIGPLACRAKVLKTMLWDKGPM